MLVPEVLCLTPRGQGIHIQVKLVSLPQPGQVEVADVADLMAMTFPRAGEGREPEALSEANVMLVVLHTPAEN